MDGAVNSASLAVWISISTSLLGGFFSLWVAMRSRRGAAENRDMAVSVLFATAFLLLLLGVIVGALFGICGVAYFGLVKAVLLLTAAFAVAGMAFGLMRGLRSERLTKPQGV